MGITVQQVLEIINCPGICVLEEEHRSFENDEDVITFLKNKGGVENYEVNKISAENDRVVLTLNKVDYTPNNLDVSWIRKHVESFGKEPSIFDGV